MKNITITILCLLSVAAIAQSDSITLETPKGKISGTLILPQGKFPVPVVLMIAGSGSTDRDGNNPMMKNNSLLFLARELEKKGIASVRYDKRGIGKSVSAKESDLRFDDYVKDASGWIRMLKTDKRFSKVIVLGHSEGSLIGMAALNVQRADGFISLAGSGRPANVIIKEQLSAQPAWVSEVGNPILDSLTAGSTVKNVDPRLANLFRPSVQPYMISWFKYNPQSEIKNLEEPVLIVQGTTDIQVSVEDAKLLASARPKAELKIVEGMNHILKSSVADRQTNLATYANPDLPVMPELIQIVTKFVMGLK